MCLNVYRPVRPTTGLWIRLPPSAVCPGVRQTRFWRGLTTLCSGFLRDLERVGLLDDRRGACFRSPTGLVHGPPDTVAKWQRRSIFNRKYLCNNLLSTEASLPRGPNERGKDAPDLGRQSCVYGSRV